MGVVPSLSWKQGTMAIKVDVGLLFLGGRVVAEVSLLVLSGNLLRLSDVCNFHEHSQ